MSTYETGQTRRARRSLQVPQLSLREDLEQRGFNPQASTQPRRDEGEIIDLYIADQPTQRSFEDRCGEAGMERSDLREFVARAEPLVFASGGDTKVIQTSRSASSVTHIIFPLCVRKLEVTILFGCLISNSGILLPPLFACLVVVPGSQQCSRTTLQVL